MKLSVVIPVYNGEKTLPDLVEKTLTSLENLHSFELLLVYDCGMDKSWEIIKKIKNNYPEKVLAYHLDRNYGQHNAILFGCTKASGDFIITIDEDFQHDPVYIKDLVNEQEKGNYDVVYGRLIEIKHPGIRKRLSNILRRILSRIIKGIYPHYSPYRLIKRETALKITEYRNCYTFIDGYIGRATKKISDVPVIHQNRLDGVTSYSYWRLLKHAVLIVLGYSPLKKWLFFISIVIDLTLLLVFLVTKEKITSLLLHDFYFPLILLFGIVLTLLTVAAEITCFRKMKTNVCPVEKSYI